MLRRRTESQAGRVLADLYREHATPTYRFALHFTGSQADAEDLLQTAFLEAHRVLLRGDELVNPRAWLARVVRTRALNLRRDRHDIPVGDDIDSAAGGVDPIESHEELRRVRAMLWGLPEAQHQAFVMRHWSGLSNREIAEVLDTTEAAVESLLVRARRALLAAEALAPACVEFRTRLADGLPETPAMRQHRHTCRSCTVAGQRLAGAAAIAGVLLLAPRASVAHALAATVPGFTASAATATATSAGAATAGKAALAKTAVTLLAVGTTAAAFHTGHIHLPTFIRNLPSHHTASRTDASEHVHTSPTPSMAVRPAIIAHTRESQAGHSAAPHADHDRAQHHDLDDQSPPAVPGTPTSPGTGNQDNQASADQDQNASGNQDDQGGGQSASGGGSAGNANSGNSNSSGSSGNSNGSGNSTNSNAGNSDNSGNASATGNGQ
jgi:RNA polymerase sigma-70 factor (ECF subfamily)